MMEAVMVMVVVVVVWGRVSSKAVQFSYIAEHKASAHLGQAGQDRRQVKPEAFREQDEIAGADRSVGRPAVSLPGGVWVWSV